MKRVPLKAKIVKRVRVGNVNVIITDFDVKEYGNGSVNKATRVVIKNLKDKGVLK